MYVSFLVLLLTAHLCIAHLPRNWMLEERLPWEDETDQFYDYRSFMSRSRRSDKITICGKRLFKMVAATCGEGCTASEENIATKCCESKCTMEEITGLCCPGR
ncbi:unnamed protein product [Caenorhabditis sp. 36 PRJEB53466]|nr:unnamed protein product [Caenorhabditis sp. 36 PRJEB53466]